MKKLYTFLILLLFTKTIISQTNQTIQGIINKVSIDSLMNNLNELCGEKQVTINNVSTRILSRNRNSAGNSYMPYYLMQKFEKLGLVSFQQNFMTDGQNVYAIQNGNKSDQYVIICAHYDNMPVTSVAPGADDNGSGTAAVLEAARVLSKYKFDYTIIYALWDLEEYGLFGSAYYAQEASFRGDKIVAVINLDMIGWDGNNDYKAEIHTKNISTTNELGFLFGDINSKYSIGLNLFTMNPGTDRSDHASFWKYSYPAVLLIEMSSDFNPYYHKVTDEISKINKTYFEKMSKLAIAVTATAATPFFGTSVVENIPVDLKLNQNYPNPFNPTTVISYQLAEANNVSLKIYDLLGNEITTLVNDFKQPGKYSTTFNAVGAALTSGVYFYKLQTGKQVLTRQMLLLK